MTRWRRLSPPSLVLAVVTALTKMGHQIELSPIVLGDVNGIVVDPDSGVSWGFADTRKGGLALGPGASDPAGASP